MTQRIVALFDSRETCLAADSQLRAQGYSTELDQLSVPTRQRERDQDPEWDAGAEEASGQPAANMWLIAVRAPFGSARRIIATLKTSGAVEIREGYARKLSEGSKGPPSYAATPVADEAGDRSFFVSSALGLPLLVNCPAPLSHLLGLPTLIRD